MVLEACVVVVELDGDELEEQLDTTTANNAVDARTADRNQRVVLRDSVPCRPRLDLLGTVMLYARPLERRPEGIDLAGSS